LVALAEFVSAGGAEAGLDIVGGEGAAGVAAGLAGMAAAEPGVEESAAGVMGSAGAAVAGAVVEAGVLGSGLEPPHAATPSAAAANPKILSRNVISIGFPPVNFEMRVPLDSRVTAVRPHD
jgi:hypothetical protein